MKLPAAAHTDKPWRIHEIAPDFVLEDVWGFDTPGAGKEDFPRFLAAIRRAGNPEDMPFPVRFLFAVRWKLGALLGLDDERAGLRDRVRPVRDRLPDDLLGTVDVALPPFESIYELPDEAAAELANGTVHGILHLGWTPGPDGSYRPQMAVLVKPNGLFGDAYMALIKPFRYLVVYPLLTRTWEMAWREHSGELLV